MHQALKQRTVGAIRTDEHRDHVILRCRSRDTIPLTKRLSGAGLTAWTPTHHRRMRIARCRKTLMIEVPTMASYVFLGSQEIQRAKKVMQRYKCPAFGVMRRNEGLVSVWDWELDQLRMLAAKADQGNMKLLEIGARAIVTTGAMADYMVDVIGRAGAVNIVMDLEKRWKISMPPHMLKEA